MGFGDIKVIKKKGMYHGTSSKNFSTFSGDVIYLTRDPHEAKAFAINPILGGGRGEGTPRVLHVDVPKGRTKNIDRIVQEVVSEGDDLDTTISHQAKLARQEGFEYLTFSHPSTIRGRNDFEAFIAINPSKIKIKKQLGLYDLKGDIY